MPLNLRPSSRTDESSYSVPELKNALPLARDANSLSELSVTKPFNSYSVKSPVYRREKRFPHGPSKTSQFYSKFRSHGTSEEVPLWQDEFNFKKQRETQEKLFHVLSDKKGFFQYSARQFYIYDKNSDQLLDFNEAKEFVHNLISELQLPRLPSNVLFKIFKKYDKHHVGYVTLVEFQNMYWDLLRTIQRVFYSTTPSSVSRSALISHTALKDQQNIHDFYCFEKKIGSGSFGQVYLVRDLCSNSIRVCKIISIADGLVPLEQIKAEIIALKKLDHPNILKILELFENAEDLFIITELCEGGELIERLEKTIHCGQILTEHYVADIMRQLLYAVNYFHSKSVVHKDLKPENVLLQTRDPDTPIKIIDFGLAELFTKYGETSQCPAGTCYYMAPEVLERHVTLKCDIWSLGCIAFQLLTGQLPFPGSTIEDVQFKLFNCDPDYSLFSERPISSSAVDFVKKMLTKNLDERPSAEECLRHRWLTSFPPLEATLSYDHLINLQVYTQQPIIKRVFFNMITHQQGISGSQLYFINRVFETLDGNKQGLLSKEDMALALSRTHLQSHEIVDIVNALDIDQSGSISYTEFLTGCFTVHLASSVMYMKLIFKRLNKEDIGKVSYQHIVDLQYSNKSMSSSVIFPNLSYENNTKQLLKMVQDMDRQKHGYIDSNDFINYLSSL